MNLTTSYLRLPASITTPTRQLELAGLRAQPDQQEASSRDQLASYSFLLCRMSWVSWSS